MVYDYYEEKNKKKSKNKNIFIGIVAVLAFIAIILFNIYYSIIELDEIGNFSSVYLKNLKYQIVSFVGCFIVIFSFLFLTNIFIKKNVKEYIKERNLPSRSFYIIPITLGISIVGALIEKTVIFQKILYFLNSTTFDKTDPIFGYDISYYIFRRPFLLSMYDFFIGLSIFIVIYTFLYYILILLSFYTNPTVSDFKVTSIIRHNLINVAIFFFIKAFSYKFQKEGILYSNFAGIDGAGYVDVNIWLKFYNIAPALLGIIVVTAFIFIWKQKLKNAFTTIVIFPVVWIIAVLVASGYQAIIVKPNEPKYESKYIKNNMIATKNAYNINKMKKLTFSDLNPITPELLEKNKETKENIRIVDFKATLDTNKQLQSLTSFYSFHDGDIINYNINGKNTPVFIAAREIDVSKLNMNEVNRRFQYTHGYGVTINPINKITSEGQNDYILSGLNYSKEGNISIKEPRIYYGELTDDYVIVNDKSEAKFLEYDGDGMTTSYSGKGGIQLSFIKKLMYSIKYSDFNILISKNVGNKSKLLLNRHIVERAQKPIPFVSIDQDPYIVIGDDGKLKWILDGYTTSSNYPYAVNINGINYIRNSVKVEIDAYDGTVKYFIIDDKDPIIKTVQKIYPELFTKEEMPEYMKTHMKYPEFLFNIQSEVIKKYHLDPSNEKEVLNFYGRQDFWDYAKLPAKETNNEQVMQAYYNMIKLPNVSKDVEFTLMRNFNPIGGRHNLDSWLAIRNSYENYGELVVYDFQKDTNVFGPYQVEVKINQIDSISKDITLWNQSGSEVFKGNLLSIPIENSMLYVEPIYIKSKGQSIPEVRLLVTGYQSGNEFKYGIGKDLDSSLKNLFENTNQLNKDNKQSDSKVDVKTNDKTKPDENSKPDEKTNNDQSLDKEQIEKIKLKYNEIKKQLDELGEMLGKTENKN